MAFSKITKEQKKSESDNTKFCIDCKKIKPLFEFAFNSKGRKFSQAHCLECQKERSLQRLYGISLADYDKMFKGQNGECKICGTKEISNVQHGRFDVDHNHETGKIRGLLCHKCNTFLGHFNDDIEILAKAIQYLIDSRKL